MWPILGRNGSELPNMAPSKFNFRRPEKRRSSSRFFGKIRSGISDAASEIPSLKTWILGRWPTYNATKMAPVAPKWIPTQDGSGGNWILGA